MKRKINKKSKFFIALIIILALSVFGNNNIVNASVKWGTLIDDLAIGGLLVGSMFTGIGGVAIIVAYGLRIVAFTIGAILESIVWAIVGEFGVEAIIFSGAKSTAHDYTSSIVDVNFFEHLNETGLLGAFCNAIAKWYYILRYISIAALLLILIYVGIRLALSTLGKEKTKYKEWLTNWVVSMALLFLLHYIMVFTFSINSSLVNSFLGLLDGKTTFEIGWTLAKNAVTTGFSGVFAAATYLIFAGITFSFLVMYIKRLVTISFLAMISPLICITYSIDKLGDGKSQALNEWLKEFIYNVLIQPFHCIIYLALVGSALDMIDQNPNSIAPYILAIAMLFFMKDAEKIIRQIFHFQANSMSGIAESGQSFANATGRFAKAGMAVGTGIVAFKNSATFGKNKFTLSERRKLKQEYNKSENNESKNGFREYLNSEKAKEKVTQWRKNDNVTARERSEKAEENRRNSTNENSNSTTNNRKKKKIRGAVGGIWSDTKTFAKDNKKLLSSLAVASLSSMAGLVMSGAQGSFDGFVTGYQSTSGLLKPILNDSSNTSVKNITSAYEKYNAVNGTNYTPEQFLALMDTVDTKTENENEKKAEDALKDTVTDSVIASEIIQQLKWAIKDDNISAEEVEDIITKIMTNAKYADKLGDTGEFKKVANDMLQAMINLEGAKYLGKCTDLGFTPDSLALRMDRRLEREGYTGNHSIEEDNSDLGASDGTPTGTSPSSDSTPTNHTDDDSSTSDGAYTSTEIHSGSTEYEDNIKEESIADVVRKMAQNGVIDESETRRFFDGLFDKIKEKVGDQVKSSEIASIALKNIDLNNGLDVETFKSEMEHEGISINAEEIRSTVESYMNSH